jgi:DNA-binding winged helix-turn-helix (wHTH) protein
MERVQRSLPPGAYGFGAFYYDPRNRQLVRDGQVLRTTPKALHVLEVLLRHKGNLVTLEELTSEVWPGVFVDRTTIHQNVATLRRLLDDDPKAPAFIETVPRVGYRFLHPVEVAAPATAELAEVVSPPSRLRGVRRVGGLAFAGGVLLTALLFQGLGQPESSVRKSPAQAEYELGRQYWNHRLGEVQSDAAENAYRRSLKLDPGFALAHVGLADVLMFSNERTEEAEREIRAALAINPRLGEAYASMGFLRMFHQQDWQGADEAFQRCLKLSPNYATGHQWRGTLLLVRGRLEEARTEFERAAALDLLSVPIESDLASVSYYQGNYRESAERMRAVLIRDPAFVFAQRYLLWSLFLGGDFRGGAAVAAQYPAMYDPLRFNVEMLRRDALEPQQVWSDMCRCPNEYEQAICWATAGDSERALQQLESAVASRRPLLMYAGVQPAFLKLRGTERFRKVLRAWKLGDLPAAR